jgi:ABC-2 type transport system ATP-binding protein
VERNEVVVSADNLGYKYISDAFAVRNLTFQVHRGEVFGLLGRNGAGKTTTVRLLTTLLRPSEGTGTLFGKDIRKCGPTERARLGVVLQAESLDTVDVEQNLRLYAYLWGVNREIAKSRSEEMLELFELTKLRTRPPWALSGGERRRFQVARELMHDMELLFLDEATVGVDAVTRNRILAYLAGRARNGLSIVFTTHILSEADRMCNRIGILQEGQMMKIATPAELKRTYRGSRMVEAEFERSLTSDEVRELTALLSSKGEALQIVLLADNRVSFQAANSETLVAELARWFGIRSIGLSRIGLQDTTLEDAFIDLVSKPAKPSVAPIAGNS